MERSDFRSHLVRGFEDIQITLTLNVLVEKIQNANANPKVVSANCFDLSQKREAVSEIIELTRTGFCPCC